MTDPFDGLLKEHALQRAVFAALSREVQRIESAPRLDPDYWDHALMFLEGFVRDRHQRKEEEVLFPVLIQRGIRDRGGVIGIVRDERRDVEARLRELGRCVAERGGVELADAWRVCEGQLSDLLAREERFVFPRARDVCDALDLARVRRGLWRVDREADRALPMAEVERITQRLGVDPAARDSIAGHDPSEP